MSQRPPEIPGLTFVQPLGAGGYADVYLYEQAMPRRRVAVKVLRDAGLSASVLQRFRSEANAMAQLAHPNIVPVYSAATTADGRPYIVMMYYPRASLAERVKRERLPVAEALQIGIKLSSAVETAHRAGMLHRDIKPANVLTDQYGNPGLGDFGIAADVAADDDDDLGVSVPWSPPELLYATQPPSVRSDVYSLAATIWHLLVGRSPFEVAGGDNSQFALMKRVRDAAPPSTGRPDVPMSLDRLLRTAMAKDPTVRPASALDLARSLQAIEQELRLPRTQLVLAADESGSTVGRSSLLDATRVQGPQRVHAQDERPVSHTPPPRMVDDDSGTVRRLPTIMAGSGSGYLDDEGKTIHRTPVTEAPVDVEPQEHSRPWLWWVLGALVVAGLAALVWVLAFAPRTDPRPLPTVSESVVPPDPGIELPPGKLTFTTKRDGSTVVFNWTYDNKLSNDSYYWRTNETGPWQQSSEPTVTLRDQPNDKVCIWVRVHRFSGNNSTMTGTKGCEP